MADAQSLLLDVWREVGKHNELGESVSLMASLLARVLPLDWLLVRRIDLQRSCLETVGAVATAGVPLPEHTRSELADHALDDLLRWCRSGALVQDDSPQAAVLRPLDTQGSFIAGPLFNEEGPAGVLVVMNVRGQSFLPQHVQLVQALLEPFSAALEHDRRLREITLLREAAEADRHSLLTRLGRQDISDTIVGVDGGLRHVLERVEMVSRLDVPVLIFGETGSGKEVIARAIHQRSRRSGGPFLRVNCGAIPSELIDSELFGHERGSFTGAVGTRKGWFERADGGTLFLDEIGELPAAAQVRLLRILQDGTFERVGAQRQLMVNVRIIAATHRDLQAMTQQGEFRQDLWYRIAVFPIDLPPLRDRPEDIPALAAHFALRACRRFGFPQRVPSPEDTNLLCAYPWPGNVRELAAVIDRAAILGNGQCLDVATALGLRGNPAPTAVAESTAKVQQPASRPLDGAAFPTLDQAMAMHIEDALRLTAGQVEGSGGAAELLGINPHTLRSRMRKLRIPWQKFRKTH